MPVEGRGAAARTCESLSSLGLQEVTSISATSIPANTFSPPPAFPGLPLGPPVPVAFCRVQITVASTVRPSRSRICMDGSTEDAVDPDFCRVDCDHASFFTLSKRKGLPHLSGSRPARSTISR